MRYNPATDHDEPITWDDAFAVIGAHFRALANPHRANFYTSGRASNEAPFLYQLFVRRFGINDFPDRSNMCHQATSVGLAESIRIGKGTVLLQDFEEINAICTAAAGDHSK
jgi:anaerobic selenocysteine-containing dehydrogenase